MKNTSVTGQKLVTGRNFHFKTIPLFSMYQNKMSS